MDLVYIAHPFRNNPKENLERVKKYVKQAIDCGYLPVCALLEIGHLHGKIDENLALDICFKYIDKCDLVWLCGDWQKSEGCRLELAYARSRNKKVEFKR